jgi:hypothetical protein
MTLECHPEEQCDERYQRHSLGELATRSRGCSKFHMDASWGILTLRVRNDNDVVIASGAKQFHNGEE